MRDEMGRNADRHVEQEFDLTESFDRCDAFLVAICLAFSPFASDFPMSVLVRYRTRM